MPLKVSYMGTKRNIASRVAAVIEESPPGPLLDLFSGVCTVGSAVASSRQVWCNDVQVFASMVARAFFTSPTLPIHFDDAADAVHGPFVENSRALEKRFATALREEEKALQSSNLERIKLLENTMPNVASSGSLERERSHLAENPTEAPYRLFSITFSGSYLGLRQSIQVDSIRYAVDLLLDTGRLDEHQHRWMCLALCQAVSKVATTTGHFAQYMRVKEKTQRRFLRQRCRSVWCEWLRAIFEFSPIGTRAWRSQNRVFMVDSAELLQALYERGERPAVVYADPPYTSAHYSRYYHLYETLLLYDYPPSEATGRYRPDRFFSRYSIKTEVEAAMGCLIAGCAKIGSRLVLSYPDQGLLPDSKNVIITLIRKHFGGAYSVVHLDHFHSSLGGSNGQEKYRVKELIFTAG